MPVSLGAESYVAGGMQTAYNSAVAPTITIAHLRTGNPITPRQGQQPRISTARVIPGADQLWTTMKTCDASYVFEPMGNPTAWLPWLRCAWGHELKAGAGPVTHTYNILNPPVESGTDGANDFYNHSMTLRHTFASNGTSIATYEIRDFCINEFTFGCEANSTARFGFSGTGQSFQTASAVSYSEPAGTPYAWNHLYAGANSGIYTGSANPPTTAMPVKSFQFTLNNNLRFEPFLGTASSQELKLPTRAGFPNAYIDFTMDFDDVSTEDAVTLMTDFITPTARNVRIEAYIDANNSIELLCSGSTKPAVITEPQFGVNSEGPVEFRTRFNIFPATASSDMKLVLTTAS